MVVNIFMKLSITIFTCTHSTHIHPPPSPDALFDLLMQMVVEPSPAGSGPLSAELSNVASACLLSLVVALGDTGKMLGALAAMLTTPPELSDITVQVCV